MVDFVGNYPNLTSKWGRVDDFVFFSSRRRHTRYWRDWSSDVCSSDLEVYKRRSALGLVGSRINVETGQWAGTDSHLGGGIDSYYEYLLKCWLLFGDEDCRSEERRVGKEGRSRWSPDHLKKKTHSTTIH